MKKFTKHEIVCKVYLKLQIKILNFFKDEVGVEEKEEV